MNQQDFDKRMLELIKQYRRFLANFPLDVSGMPDEIIEKMSKWNVQIGWCDNAETGLD